MNEKIKSYEAIVSELKEILKRLKKPEIDTSDAIVELEKATQLFNELVGIIDDLEVSISQEGEIND